MRLFAGLEAADRPGCRAVETFEFSCPAAGPGEHLRYPDPAHCGRYYVCIAGAAQQHHCPPGLVFHPDSLACTVQVSLVFCHCHTTT